MQPKISVIVPIYKAEIRLAKCIDSILSQSYETIEIILVDDGSPDNSGNICDDYAIKDKRIKVIHKHNGGVTAARATGVDNATGDYITFVDADDMLKEGALDTFMEYMSNDCDIVIGSYETNGPHISPIKEDATISLGDYIPKTIVKSGIHQGPCGKLYRKSLFNEQTFNIPREIVYGEDTIMNIRLAFNAKGNIRTTSKKVYYYFDNISGCCNTFSCEYAYLQLWYRHIQDSIPEGNRQKYLAECIGFRFIYFDCIHKYYISSNRWRKSEFHKELLRDTAQCNYRLSFGQRLSVVCNNPISSWLYLKLIRIYKLVNKIRS